MAATRKKTRRTENDEENEIEKGYREKEIRLKVATRQATFYQNLEASLTSQWSHNSHPLIKKLGLADYLLDFQLKCKRHRDALTLEITGLMVLLGLSGEDDDE